MFGKWKKIIEIIQNLTNIVDRLTEENKILRQHYNEMSEKLKYYNQLKKSDE